MTAFSLSPPLPMRIYSFDLSGTRGRCRHYPTTHMHHLWTHRSFPLLLAPFLIAVGESRDEKWKEEEEEDISRSI